MASTLRVALGILVFSAGSQAVVAQDAPAITNAKVDLRWVETRRLEGVTEESGFQSSCDPKDIVYPHKKPALILTAAEIAEARLTGHTFAGREHYLVALHLTKEAREKLAATCEGKEMRLLTVVVDGKCWGVHRYEKDRDKPFVPTQARAETFIPDVGFFSSKNEAERLVNAFQ